MKHFILISYVVSIFSIFAAGMVVLALTIIESKDYSLSERIIIAVSYLLVMFLGILTNIDKGGTSNDTKRNKKIKV